jgi:hypothetical protein
MEILEKVGGGLISKYPDPIWGRMLAYKKDIIVAFAKILGEVMTRFEKNDYPEELKKDIFGEVLTQAIAHGLVKDRELQERFLVEPSTVNRWRNGESIPPKKKQVLVLRLIHDSVDRALTAIEEFEAQLASVQRLASASKGRKPAAAKNR